MGRMAGSQPPLTQGPGQQVRAPTTCRETPQMGTSPLGVLILSGGTETGQPQVGTQPGGTSQGSCGGSQAGETGLLGAGFLQEQVGESEASFGGQMVGDDAGLWGQVSCGWGG